jgi:predicted enzyme related to lactoylglutathione lyase
MTDETNRARPHANISVHGVRYQVKDVARAVTFYTERLGFKLEHQQPSCIRQRLARIVHAAAERSGSIRIPADAWWEAPGAGWMESSGSSRE